MTGAVPTSFPQLTPASIYRNPATTSPGLDDPRHLNEKKQIEALKKRDAEVRAHEMAHLTAAGGLARGGASFQYQSGPNGQQYAVGGEVQIDTSPVEGDPQATIRKARQIRAAALAPRDPSAQDRRVAAEASRMEMEAQRELNNISREEAPGYNREGAAQFSPSEANILNLLM